MTYSATPIWPAPRTALVTPPSLVEALSAELKQVKVPLARQIGSLRQLFELFTNDRKRLRSFAYLDDPKLRGAYLRYHLPLNAARVSYALQQAALIEPRLLQVNRVVDLGSGPGSAALATAEILGRPDEVRYQLFDRSLGALGVSRRLFPNGTAVRATKWLLPSLPELPAGGLVLLSMVLNELLTGGRKDASADLVARLTPGFAPGTFMLVIEPALRGPARDLMQFRDAAVRSGCWRVFAPCPHQKDCPLLKVMDRSWCHFRFRWDAPDLVRRVADPLRLEYAQPSLAYLAMERIDPDAPRVATKQKTQARIISEPFAFEGRETGIYLCADGRRELVKPVPSPWHYGDVVAQE